MDDNIEIAIEKGAIFSHCGKFRYLLIRKWDKHKPEVLFVLHNPSTADAEQDDPTIRRCIGFAKSWGFGSLTVVNVFPFRCTNPKELKRDPVKESLNEIIAYQALGQASMAVLAYGNGVKPKDIPCWVKQIETPYCIAVTKGGNPSHPLYLKKSLGPKPYTFKL